MTVAGHGPDAHADTPPGVEYHGIEQHGIDIIAERDRWGRPKQLLPFWLGVTLNIEFFVFGGLLPVIGLSFPQSVVAILIGNLAWIITGFTSLQGPKTGTATFAVTRAAYGTKGGRLPAIFNWLSLVVYETVGLALIVLGALALITEFGGSTSDGLMLALVPLAAIFQFVLPFLGHRKILRFVNWLVAPFLLLYLILAILVAPKVEVSGDAASTPTFLLGLAIVGATGGLAFVMLGSDYSRYLPSQSSQRAIVRSVALGGYLGSAPVMLLGAAVGSVVSQQVATEDPITGLNEIFPTWFIVPYLLVILAQLYAINAVDLYSSALALQSAGLPFKRWHCVLIDTLICSAVTALALYSSSFNVFVANVALMVMVWLAPWVGVYLSDWRLRRGEYRAGELFKSDGGLYHGTGGWRISALVAQGSGMLAALLASNTSFYTGPIARAFWDIDLSIPLGIGVAASVYILLSRRDVRRELVESR